MWYTDIIKDNFKNGTGKKFNELYNDLKHKTFNIVNCKSGEIVTDNYPIIESSLLSYRFKWQFFKAATLFLNNLIEIIISIPCTITTKYMSYIKINI